MTGVTLGQPGEGSQPEVVGGVAGRARGQPVVSETRVLWFPRLRQRHGVGSGGYRGEWSAT